MLISVLDLEKVTGQRHHGAAREIVGIDVNDDWKSIMRQLTHSPHGRIVLYRGSLDDAIGMLRVREAPPPDDREKEFNKENLLRAAVRSISLPEGTPLNVQLVKFQRNKKRSASWSTGTATFRSWSRWRHSQRSSATSPTSMSPTLAKRKSRRR